MILRRKIRITFPNIDVISKSLGASSCTQYESGAKSKVAFFRKTFFHPCRPHEKQLASQSLLPAVDIRFLAKYALFVL